MRVDFYILAAADAAARETFCCRLAEKAYQQGYRVYVLTADRGEAERLDGHLWTFRAGSFVPHAMSGEAVDEPVVLGETAPANDVDVLINLAPTLPPSWQSFARIAEIVSQDPAVREPAREHFRRYRDAGVEPVSHRL